MLSQFERFLSKKLNGNFIKMNHLSYNRHYSGYSERLNKKVFIKVFEDEKKFEKEKAIVLSMTENYVQDFMLEGRFVLVLDYKDYQEITTLSDSDLVEIAKIISYFHKYTRLDLEEHDKNISDKIDATLAKLIDRENYGYLEKIVSSFRGLYGHINQAFINTEKVTIHGDFTLRNIKMYSNTLELIDFERASKTTYYMDFIKFFYIDLDSQKDKIDLFLSSYYKDSGFKPISQVLQYALILYSGLGIMKYTMDFNDKPFEEIGLRMIKDVESFLGSKTVSYH